MRRRSAAVMTAVGLGARRRDPLHARARRARRRAARPRHPVMCSRCCCRPAAWRSRSPSTAAPSSSTLGMADTARKQAMDVGCAVQPRLGRQGVHVHPAGAGGASAARSRSTTRWAKYVTELQQGGDIRKVTLGQLASHTSGLPSRAAAIRDLAPRANIRCPDFIRYLNALAGGQTATSPASRTSIPTPASCCWRWRCSAGSTCRYGEAAGAAPAARRSA